MKGKVIFIRVLIACEESQEVCKAFRELGHEAYSCDLEGCSGDHSEWHIQVDALELIKIKWDLIIAHPPCTFLSNAGACRMYPHKGQIDLDRYQKALEAKNFFMKFLNADCPRIAIENPRPLKVVGLPEETQRIQPYQFGEPFSKLTYLWLKNLPPLMPTKILNSYKPYVSCGTSANKGNPDKAGVSRAGGAAKIRSKTFPGVAKAMALQWGNLEGGVSMKKIKVAWIEQILEFDSVEEATGYRKSLETGRPQKFKILDERIIESGKVEIRIRKQYNNNAFPDD